MTDKGPGGMDVELNRLLGAMTDAQFRERATTILKHLALERTGWRRWLLGRWYISDEPLRNDAANLLRAARWHHGLYPIHTRFVGEESHEQRRG